MKDLTGNIHNNLKVLGLDHVSKHRRSMWKCQCYCGRHTVVDGTKLKSGTTKSCGCLRVNRKPKDLSGKIYNGVKIEKLSHKDANGKYVYECTCSCGSVFLTVGIRVKNGHTKSCGCKSTDRSSRIVDYTGKKFNGIVVLRREGLTTEKRPKVNWLCKCHCGKEFLLNSDQIRTERAKSCGCKHWPKGSESPNYKPWLSDKDRSRDNEDYRKWRLSVYERDGFKCVCCKNNKEYLNAHHLNPYKDFKNLRYSASNGVTMCRDCHIEFHKVYGYTNFTEKDYYKFKKRKE